LGFIWRVSSGLSPPDGFALGLEVVERKQSLALVVARRQHYTVVQELVDGRQDLPSVTSLVGYVVEVLKYSLIK
jgi:hypothetical protein